MFTFNSLKGFRDWAQESVPEMLAVTADVRSGAIFTSVTISVPTIEPEIKAATNFRYEIPPETSKTTRATLCTSKHRASHKDTHKKRRDNQSL